MGVFFAAVVFKDGRNVDTAKEFVRFLVAEGWLAHYLDFSGRAHAAGDAEAARSAVLARPERPAPHGRGDADLHRGPRNTSTAWSRATGGTTWYGRS